MKNTNKEEILQVVNFSTRDFHGSIDINYLSKVIALPRLTATPTGPDYLIGLINLAGSIIPVIDLSMRLKLGQPDRYTLNTPIIICQTSKNKMFGMIVDVVSDISDIQRDMIEDGVGASSNDNIVMGAITFDSFISLLINVDSIIDNDSLYEFHHEKESG